MQITKVIIVGSFLAASLLGPVLGVGVEASKVGQVKLLGEHGLGMAITSDGYAAARELKARDTTAVSEGSLGLFGGLEEAAQDIFGRHDSHDGVSNVLFGATGAIQ